MTARQLFCSIFLLFATAGAHAEAAAGAGSDIEVRGVEATEPGKPADVPKELAAYKKSLSATVYGKFKDLGTQSVKGKGGSATYGGYSVEIKVVKALPKSTKVEVTIKENGKPLGTPAAMDLKKDEPVMLKAGEREKQTIFLLSRKD